MTCTFAFISALSPRLLLLLYRLVGSSSLSLWGQEKKRYSSNRLVGMAADVVVVVVVVKQARKYDCIL